MKKNFLLLSISLITMTLLFTNCGDDDDTLIDLPSVITDYISNNYPDYTIDESEQGTLCEGTAVYEVEIENSNDEELELTFDTEGNLLFTETEIQTADLPSEVSTSIATNYADYSIDEAEQLNMFDNTLRFEVEIENGTTTLNVLLEADGTVVCEEEELED